MARRVLIYELNEVPWEILDRFVADHPGSHIAGLLRDGRCETTVNEDSHHLSPWVTWPTFHKATYSDQHHSYDLGQDPDTFRGTNLWDVTDDAGLTVGIFGPLQSWPPRAFINGGFYVPDTFSRTPEAFPPTMEPFQRFNLAMTQQLGFSADAPLDKKQIARAGYDVVRRGLTPWSVGWILRQLMREQRDPRYKAARSMIQALPAFDLYWRLHRQTEPHLSIFFTNHVAGMLHRFWGDAVSSYAEQFDYAPDPVYRGFVDSSMFIVDHHVGRIRSYIEAHPEAVLIIAGSMGQAAVPYSHVGDTYVLEDGQRLAELLCLGEAEDLLAMYPRNSLEFADTAAAELAAAALATVMCGSEPLFSGIGVTGRSVAFTVRYEIDANGLSRDVTYQRVGDDERRAATIEELGVHITARLGGGNTAYHIPEGIYITCGAGVDSDPSRAPFSVLDASPRILDLLGVPDAKAKLSVEPFAPHPA